MWRRLSKSRAWASLALMTATACSSGSGAREVAAEKADAMPAACADYATQVRKCFGTDAARVERALTRFASVPADPEAAAQQQEICTREAARLRIACK